eukprot:CAMPEP_0170491964 /NCGR_PEP_ID=MMETSP0208-20121228/11428_1 /TAXON_ID=197538 /ORGANISM="Strombidium inclinatum, Strain S3" /LENGTH=452 /DNA_ID=CAMNT_0010767625 /DNA_START=11 /DNA_END=1369 /DNA_ORIENTATION=-
MITAATRRAFATKTMPKLKGFTPSYTGPSYKRVKEMREHHAHPAAFHFYRTPVMIVEGKMQYLFDETGRQYLDLFSGISTVGMGHCHPRITEKIVEQMHKLQHVTTIYLNDQHSLYAKELADKLPPGLDHVFFVSSGSEANSFATNLARLATKHYPIVTLRNGYHGAQGSGHLTSIGNWNQNIPRTQGIEQAAFPDSYRSAYAPQDQAHYYSKDVEDTIAFCTSGNVALFMAEAVQGVGGIYPLPDGYLKKAYSHVRAAGGLCLSDEVQTGFGRLGSHYWGFEEAGVVPDIVTMAKQIGNGFPLAAVACSSKIVQPFEKLCFTTYGGNPAAMAAGREVLRVIDDEQLMENSKAMGDLFLAGFKKMMDKYEVIGDVRGKGLMIGVEIVKDKESQAPHTDLVNDIFERTKDRGLLLGKGGRFGNIFRVQPPMCLNADDVEFALWAFEEALKESL